MCEGRQSYVWREQDTKVKFFIPWYFSVVIAATFSGSKMI